MKLVLLAYFLLFCSSSKSHMFGTTPIGDDCNVDSDCNGYPDTTHCNSNKLCWCLDELIFLPIGGALYCLPKATENGEECMDAAQCQQGTPGSLSDCLPSEETPNKMVCNCTQDAIYEPPNHRCYPRAYLIGDGCTINKQCTVNLGGYSRCNSSYKCDCLIDAIPNRDNTGCLPIRDNLLDECELNEQCQDGIPGFWSECTEIIENGIPSGEKGCQCKIEAINDPGSGTDECYEKRIYIGEECMVNAQCKFNLGDLSECSKGECSCIVDTSVSNNDGTLCLPKATSVGEECIEKQQCTDGIPGPESDCMQSLTDPNNFVCSCTDKAVQIPGGEICLKKAEAVGDSCSHIIQCTSKLGELSECSDDNKCACLDNKSIPSENRDMCLEIINELDGSCIESSQCQKGEPGVLSLCQEGRCQCSTDATNEPGQNLCRPRSGYIGGDCDVNAQCKANLGDLSECQNRKCICTPNNGIPSSSRLECLPIINFIGNDCQESQQCKEGVPGEHSDCMVSNTMPGNSKVCNCTANAIRQPGQHKCHLVADLIGADCEVNAQCQVNLGEFSECNDESECSCIDDKSIPGSSNNKCLPIIDVIGGSCEENPQCILGAPGDYSECRRADVFPYQTVCNCTEEGINEPGKHECLRKANAVYEPCTYDGQCTSKLGNLAECSDEGLCGCKAGAVPNSEKDRCIPGGVLISQPCFDTQQCVGIPGTTSICTRSNICDCLKDFIPSSKLDDCLPVLSKIGDECIERHQCQQGELGEHSDCFLTDDPLVKVCNCTTEATTEAGGNKCHLKAVHVGDPCLVNIQCVANLQYSQCLGGNCICFSNSTASSDNTKCLQRSYLDQPCIDSNQCSMIQHAECSDEEFVCKCVEGFIPHPYKPNTCIELASHIGDFCEDEVQCKAVQDSYCAVTETCECDSNTFVESMDKDKCLIKRNNLNEGCEEGQQCLVENSECMGQEDLKSCQCNPDEYVVVGGTYQKCLPIRYNEGQSCADTKQCLAGIGEHSECSLGICRCSYPYMFHEGRCYYPVPLGGTCNNDEQCVVEANEYAFCSKSNTCMCYDFAFPVADTCWVNKIVGDECKFDAECTMTIIGPVGCSNATHLCTCKSGYNSDTGGIRCSGVLRQAVLKVYVLVMPIVFLFICK